MNNQTKRMQKKAKAWDAGNAKTSARKKAAKAEAEKVRQAVFLSFLQCCFFDSPHFGNLWQQHATILQVTRNAMRWPKGNLSVRTLFALLN